MKPTPEQVERAQEVRRRWKHDESACESFIKREGLAAYHRPRVKCTCDERAVAQALADEYARGMERAVVIAENADTGRDEYLLAKADLIGEQEDAATIRKGVFTRAVAERALHRKNIIAAIRAEIGGE